MVQQVKSAKTALSREACARAALLRGAELRGIARWKSPLAIGNTIRFQTDDPPLELPVIVTWLGLPPNA